MSGKSNLLTIMSSVIGDYLNQRTDDLKKNIISGLAAGFSRLLVIIVIALLLLIVLATVAYAVMILLAEALGSFWGAALIVAGGFLTVTSILFFMRKRLFINMFTNLLTEIMYTESTDDSWKSFLLILVRDLRRNLNDRS